MFPFLSRILPSSISLLFSFSLPLYEVDDRVSLADYHALHFPDYRRVEMEVNCSLHQIRQLRLCLLELLVDLLDVLVVQRLELQKGGG